MANQTLVTIVGTKVRFEGSKIARVQSEVYLTVSVFTSMHNRYFIFNAFYRPLILSTADVLGPNCLHRLSADDKSRL